MQNQNVTGEIPPGFRLRSSLQGHQEAILRMAWANGGKVLTLVYADGRVRLWDTHTGQPVFLTDLPEKVISITWTPGGQLLALTEQGIYHYHWDKQTSQLIPFKSRFVNIGDVAWAPDGKLVAFLAYRQSERAYGESDLTRKLYLLDVQTGQRFPVNDPPGEVSSIAWTGDGQTLAIGYALYTSACPFCGWTEVRPGDNFCLNCGNRLSLNQGPHNSAISLWTRQTNQSKQASKDVAGPVTSLGWSLDQRILVSGSHNNTIQIWDVNAQRLIRVLESHVTKIKHLSFSGDGNFLASQAEDAIYIWRTDTWEPVVYIKEPALINALEGVSFNPRFRMIATLSEGGTSVCLWDMDVNALLQTAPTTSSAYYTNAKVVLVGDSGVGKTGLGLVLSGQPFVATESTHGRHVWVFENQEVQLDTSHLGKGSVNADRKGIHETLLWDLAGQSGYRLIHQLHLNEVSVALVVFDPHKETDLFAGVPHWVRALRMAQRFQEDSTRQIKKFLVAARLDRGGKRVSQKRIDELVQQLGLDGYFETSAKEGGGIDELIKAIREAIDWTELPKVTSSLLFQHIKAFLIAEKESGRLLSTFDDLYRAFLKSEASLRETQDTYAQFKTCLKQMESKGLIRRLSFGNLILLQPELLDAYASALVNAVKSEPDSLGSISEKLARTGDFPIPKSERISNQEQEKLLLIAMIEDLLRYEIALSEQGHDGTYLVFPSQSTRENLNQLNQNGQPAVVFRFDGPVLNMYATLVVRLSHSGLFIKQELWKDAVTFTTKFGGTYGISLRDTGEGRGELTLFFDKAAREETCFHFEEYIKTHLERRALAETITRQRIFICSGCETSLSEEQVTKRRQRGFNWITCSVCDTKISLLDGEERLKTVPGSLVSEMDRSVEQQRSRLTSEMTLQGKIAIKDYDVFLCYNRANESLVKAIGETLKERGILPWLDEWELPPGRPWLPLVEKQIGKIKSAAVFVGENDIGPWQKQELYALLNEFVNRNCPVIPVLLQGTIKVPELPIFLKGMTWVDFRKQDPNPMQQLIWGITGNNNRT